MVRGKVWSSVCVIGCAMPLSLRGITDLVAEVDPHLPVRAHTGPRAVEEYDPTELIVVLATPGYPEVASTVLSLAQAGLSVVVFGSLSERPRGILLGRGIPVISSDEERWLTRIVSEGLGALPERARELMRPLLHSVALTPAEANVAQLFIDHPGISRAGLAELGKVTESTVKVHLRSIRRKTGLKNVRGAAFAVALKEMWPTGVTAGPAAVSLKKPGNGGMCDHVA